MTLLQVFSQLEGELLAPLTITLVAAAHNRDLIGTIVKWFALKDFVISERQYAWV
jgi:hypothetical protein